MPNTLVHLGVQGLGNRLISRSIDLKWAFVGCIIPDVPWILRRALITFFPGLDRYQLTLYATVQASLLFCVLLAVILACLSARPRLVFMILAGNALFHLLLDATEIKWGNGVNLLAPLTWELFSFGWVWPDSRLVAALTLVGLAVAIWALLRPASNPIGLRFRPSLLYAAVLLLFLYALSPLALLEGPYSTNAHSIATLQEREQRVGRELRAERKLYIHGAGGDTVILAGERVRVVGDVRATSSQVSLIGEFVDVDAIRIHQLYEYHYQWRDLAVYVGLGAVVLIWVTAIVREKWGRARPVER